LLVKKIDLKRKLLLIRRYGQRMLAIVL